MDTEKCTYKSQKNRAKKMVDNQRSIVIIKNNRYLKFKVKPFNLIYRVTSLQSVRKYKFEITIIVNYFKYVDIMVSKTNEN